MFNIKKKNKLSLSPEIQTDNLPEKKRYIVYKLQDMDCKLRKRPQIDRIRIH